MEAKSIIVLDDGQKTIVEVGSHHVTRILFDILGAYVKQDDDTELFIPMHRIYEATLSKDTKPKIPSVKQTNI